MEKTKDNENYTHILKYTSIFGGIQLLVILVGVIRSKLVAVILGPSGMGLSSIFSSTTNLISNSTNFGLPVSAVKNISQAYASGTPRDVEREIMTVRSWSLLTALLGTLACAALSPLVNDIVFSWGNHTLHFALLSPIVGMTAITGGETAILKATRQLHHLATISIYNIIGSLVTSIPLYYYFSEAAIVPSLAIAAFIQMALTIRYSLKLHPLKLSFSKSNLSQGLFMIKLGLAFVLAGIMNNGADFLIRTYLNNAGSLTTVGLYSAGFTITMVYAGMVFSAMETEYFPRLSSIAKDTRKMNDVVNKQAEVSILLISPMMTCFIIAMPLLLPLLYSGNFMQALGMIQASALSIYMRAIYLPIEYITLANGHSRKFLLMESISNIINIAAVTTGYHYAGLYGLGLGISAAATLETILAGLYFHKAYHYTPSRNIIKATLLQTLIGILAFLTTTIEYTTTTYWLIGLPLAALSTTLSFHILRKKTTH